MFNVAEGNPFFPFDREVGGTHFIIRLPRPTLQRPLPKVIKGCLSEASEIVEAITGDGDRSLENFLSENWDGEMVSEERVIEEFVDLLLYTTSVLDKFGEQKVNPILQRVFEKNYSRGYYSQTEYRRDNENERGY